MVLQFGLKCVQQKAIKNWRIFFHFMLTQLSWMWYFFVIDPAIKAGYSSSTDCHLT